MNTILYQMTYHTKCYLVHNLNTDIADWSSHKHILIKYIDHDFHTSSTQAKKFSKAKSSNHGFILRQLSTTINFHFPFRTAGTRSLRFHFIHHVQSFNNMTKHHMFVI